MSHSEPGNDDAGRLSRWSARLRAWLHGLPNLPFFLGVMIGFAGCAFAGRVVSGAPMFEKFVRFFAPIQPGRYFYPTASQLAAHVRHHTPPGKIPVIVGGASYFRGTGQNPTDVWTLELQRKLGDRYVVFNFAIDQAPITAFAAVAFTIIAQEYPDALYVANGNPMSGAPWDGGDVYGYVFWDAYYKGLLPTSIADAPRIREFARKQRANAETLETHLGKWIDRFAYACDLWTWISYKYLFTVWADEHWRDPWLPRRHQVDGNDPNIRQTQLAIRRDEKYIRHSEEHGRNASRDRFKKQRDGTWVPDERAWSGLAEEWKNLFPDELRPRCIVVFLRGNPYFMQTLTAEERARTELQYALGQRNLEGAGYRVVQFQADELTPDDFYDGGHFVHSGGVKIAEKIAQHIVRRDEGRGSRVER
jgi:hypothetical protein